LAQAFGVKPFLCSCVAWPYTKLFSAEHLPLARQRRSAMGQIQSCYGDVHMCGLAEIKLPGDLAQANPQTGALPTLLTGASLRKPPSNLEKRFIDVGAKPILGDDSTKETQATAARRIQAVFRGAAVRFQLKKGLEVKEEAAVTIQSAYRAHAVRRLMPKATDQSMEKKRRAKEEKKKSRKADRKAAKDAVQPFLAKHGFQGVKAMKVRFWRKNYPLHVAVKENDSETVTLLLKANADPRQADSFGRTPLELAGRLDHAGSHALVMNAFRPLLARRNSLFPLPPLPETEA